MSNHLTVAIKVSNLSKTYRLYSKPIDRLKESLHIFKKKYHKDFYALEDINFEIMKGEVVGIIGKNGSGKSTLLKLITKVLSPTSGTINVIGKVSAILELGAGFNPEMTGLENIYLNSYINGMKSDEIKSKIDEIISFAELGDFIHQPVKMYSSGMKARLAFAVSISVEPDILIVDEALSVGDAAFARKCFAKIEEIRAQGATILFVSHSESSIVSLCTRAIWINQGKLILDGVPKLVTGLYMKYSDAKIIDVNKIEVEYKRTRNDKTIKTESISAKTSDSVNSRSKDDFCLELYDPNLVPKSTITYPCNGAEIRNIKIQTLEAKLVNVLLSGKTYIFRYDVVLENESESILCAMMIKNIEGFFFGGGHLPSKKNYSSFNKKEFTIEWEWQCNLLEGVYFFNCGVSNPHGFLARILDAVMFKVIERKESSTSVGPVDFMINTRII